MQQRLLDSDAVVWPIKLELNKESVMYIKKRITFEFPQVGKKIKKDGTYYPSWEA